eukprot:4145618-Prymnesium_polylepis.1
MMLSVLSAASVTEPSTCTQHDTQALCMVFRRQHGCAWDEVLERCVAELPCEARTATDCEYELTTGSTWE